MRKALVLVMAVTLFGLGSPVWAGGEKVLASVLGTTIPGDKSSQTVQKLLKEDGIYVNVLDAAGKNLWQSENLGLEEKKFMIDGKTQSLALKDLNGDGIPEIFAAAFYGPKASGLFIYTWDAKEKKFAPIMTTFPKEDLTREMLVSDVYLESGEDLVIQEGGMARVTGMIFPEKPEEEAHPAFYLFKFDKDRYVFQKTEPFEGTKKTEEKKQ